MPSTPHDALFKAAFAQPETAAEFVRARLSPALVAAIDWDSMAAVSGSFVDPELRQRHSDLLFSAAVRDANDARAYFYLLLEHQSSNDSDMPLRVLIYMTRIWEHFRRQHPDAPLPVVLPFVVSHAPGGWTAPTRFAELFDPHARELEGVAAHLPNFEFLLDDLATFSDDQIRQRVAAVFGQLVLWAFRDARNAHTLLPKLPAWARAFSAVLRAPNGQAALEQLFRYLAEVTEDMHFDTIRATIVELAPEAEPAARTISVVAAGLS